MLLISKTRLNTFMYGYGLSAYCFSAFYYKTNGGLLEVRFGLFLNIVLVLTYIRTDHPMADINIYNLTFDPFLRGYGCLQTSAFCLLFY